MTSIRSDNRFPDQLRPLELTPDWSLHAEGSCLVEWGDTKVLCTATLDTQVPPWLRGKGSGWLTAEYSMLPRATGNRKQRDRSGKVDGRSVEIQRLIGRSLRAVTNLEKLGERTITLDCDVLQADGGTRCASIVGAWVALQRALMNEKRGAQNAVASPVAAVSIGLLKGELMLDLNYPEDSSADLDMTVVMNDSKQLIEVHAGGEGATFSREQMNSMLTLAEDGIAQIVALQRAAIEH